MCDIAHQRGNFATATKHDHHLGIGALCLGFGGPDDIRQKRARYDRAIASRDPNKIAGKVPTDHLAALCPAVVLKDRSRARAIGSRGQRFFVDALNYCYAGGPEPDPNAEPGEAVTGQISEEVLEAGTGAHGDGLTSFGDPDDIRAYVAALADAGADEVMFLIQMGTVPQDACLESIRLIGEQVIPEYRS